MARNRMTFGEVPFQLPSEKIREFIDRYQPSEHLHEIAERPAANPRLQHLGFVRTPFQAPRLNDLFYPSEASRWAWFRGLMTRSDLQTVEEAAFAGDTATALEFVLEAEGTSISTNLYMLPARPVCDLGEQYTDFDGLYLVTLVDERYFWQSRGAGKIRCQDATASWSGLITAIASVLGVSISVSGIDSVYGVPEPDSALYSNQESPTALLDAIAHNLGRVLVRSFDGSYTLQRWEAANVLALGAGLGDLAVTRTAGGPILPFDPAASSPRRAAVLPKKVKVTFPRWVTNQGYEMPTTLYRGWELDSYHDVYEVQINAADLSGAYAALPTYDAEAVLRVTAKAKLAASGDVTPTNNSDLHDTAEQLAYDFYDRNLGAADVSYPGIFAADPLWACDILFAWTGAGKPYTRVNRPAWNLQPQEFQIGLEAIRIPKLGSFQAYLTAKSGSPAKWSFVPLTMVAGVETPGTPVTDYCAAPYTIDGVSLCNPVAALRVRMWPTGEVIAGIRQFEFLPIGYADSTHPGLISIGTQHIPGDKIFDDDVTVEGDADVVGNLDVGGDATVVGDVWVDGTIHSEFSVSVYHSDAVLGEPPFNGEAVISADVSFAGNGIPPSFLAASFFQCVSSAVFPYTSPFTHPGWIVTDAQNFSNSSVLGVLTNADFWLLFQSGEVQPDNYPARLIVNGGYAVLEGPVNWFDFNSGIVRTGLTKKIPYVASVALVSLGSGSYGLSVVNRVVEYSGGIIVCDRLATDLTGCADPICTGSVPPPPPPPPVVSYNCTATCCVDPGDGTGTYTGDTALTDCQAACLSVTVLGSTSVTTVAGFHDATATLTGISVPAGQRLYVACFTVTSGTTQTDAAVYSGSASYHGNTAFFDYGTSGSDTLTLPSGGTYQGSVQLLLQTVSAATTGNLVVTGHTANGTGGVTITIIAFLVKCSPNAKSPHHASGSGTAPDAGPLVITSVPTPLISLIGLADSGGATAGTWGGGFTGLASVSGNSGKNRFQLGYQLATVAATYDASLTGTAPAQWAAFERGMGS